MKDKKDQFPERTSINLSPSIEVSEKSSEKLFAWLGKNTFKLNELINQDDSLTDVDKILLIKEFNSSVLINNNNGSLVNLRECSKISSAGNVTTKKNPSQEIKLNKSSTDNRPRSISHNPVYGKKRVQLPPLDLEFNLTGGKRERASSVIIDKKYSPRKIFTSSNDSTDSEDSSKGMGKSPGRSPGRSPKKVIMTNYTSSDGSKKKENSGKNEMSGSCENLVRNDAHRKKSGGSIIGFFSTSDPGKKNNINYFDKKTNTFTIPIDVSTAKIYREHAKSKFSDKTIIVTSPDNKYEIMVSAIDKEAYLLDKNRSVGSGGYAKIHPAFNLKTGELVSAKIFYENKGDYALEENNTLILIDNYFMKNYQKRRYFGYYHSKEERKYILLKNFEPGITLQDFLYEINPAGKEYNLCLSSQESLLGENTLYLEPGDGFIQYTVITPKKNTVTDIIYQHQFNYCRLSKELTLEQLRPLTDKLLDVTSKRDHTYPKYYLKKKKLSPFLTLEIIHQIMEQVNHLHDCGVVHTDLNLKNIIIEMGVDEKPIIGLIDFDSAFSIEMVHGYQLEIRNEDSKIQKDTLYLEVKKNQLHYTVIDLKGIPRTHYIDENNLGCSLNDDITIDKLKKYLPNILAFTSKKGHTHAGNRKPVWPGEHPGFLPPMINNKLWPYDISYDICQLSIVTAGIITDEHLPDVIRVQHFVSYPTIPTVPMVLDGLDDVSGKRNHKRCSGSELLIEENIKNIIYQDIIFPMLSELVHLMSMKAKGISLSDELNKLKLLEKQCTHYFKQINGLFLDTVQAQSTLMTIIDLAYKDKYNTEVRESLVEPQIFTKMLFELFELFKSNLTISTEDEHSFSFK